MAYALAALQFIPDVSAYSSRPRRDAALMLDASVMLNAPKTFLKKEISLVYIGLIVSTYFILISYNSVYHQTTTENTQFGTPDDVKALGAASRTQKQTVPTS